MPLEAMLAKKFDSILMDGRITKEVVVSENLKITLTPLNQGQMLKARRNVSPAFKGDVLAYSSAEGVEVLSRAITAINGEGVRNIAAESGEMVEGVDVDEFCALAIKKILLKFPPKVLIMIEEEYNSAVKEQADLLTKDFGKNIENF